MGASPGEAPGDSVTKWAESPTETEVQRAERLGSVWLQRYRRIEGSSLLPSVEPLNELLLALDFFVDLREEDARAVQADAPIATETKQASDPLKDNSEGETDSECQFDGGNKLQKDNVVNKLPLGKSWCHLRPIPTVIQNEYQYVGFFLPLFLQEAKQALARAIKLDMGPAEEFVQVSCSK